MLASVNFTEYNMHSAVYTSPDFGGWFLDYAHFDSDAPDALAGAYVLVWSFLINGVWYIDHVFCANMGEYAWKLECVIPAKDLTRGSELCELPLYVFSTFCPNVPPKREGLT
ncbi:MAG: hypothetical protein J1E98_03500 [Lachnospiraceae bacterium]|nr:hypothetical protein [Lachnospiraceae bacterium]